MAPETRQPGTKAESGALFNAKEVRRHIRSHETARRLIVELFEALARHGLEALAGATTAGAFGFDAERLGQDRAVVVEEVLHGFGLFGLLADRLGRIGLVLVRVFGTGEPLTLGTASPLVPSDRLRRQVFQVEPLATERPNAIAEHPTATAQRGTSPGAHRRAPDERRGAFDGVLTDPTHGFLAGDEPESADGLRHVDGTLFAHLARCLRRHFDRGIRECRCLCDPCRRLDASAGQPLEDVLGQLAAGDSHRLVFFEGFGVATDILAGGAKALFGEVDRADRAGQ
ncbi:hypothetical protein C475_18756 [Halosimplex carlsbadense 2-9-1]|uniref:Uncharacterized protein n=1 Tax=Halosimplex carlsbadense 2-9-1 TaxID=797114 RepID=M0CGK5_9EURY|nr:hypothetical protein C475_18756 [Halosimplex carlsbadense 2-9-1]